MNSYAPGTAGHSWRRRGGTVATELAHDTQPPQTNAVRQAEVAERVMPQRARIRGVGYYNNVDIV